MRIGIIRIGETDEIINYQKILNKRLSSSGHSIKLYTEKLPQGERLTINQHLIFIVDSGSIFRQSSEKTLSSFLKKYGDLNVKYASLFINNRLFPNKIFVKLMKILEENGLILQFTDIIKDDSDLEAILSDIKFEE